jgi:thymidylate synthase (FAD)
MIDVLFRSGMTVELDRWLGDDALIAASARVTRPTEHRQDTEVREAGLSASAQSRDHRLMTMLMRDRHGTPWEAVVLRFYVEAPLFVATQFNRHRIASVSAASGRYREQQPVFYLPAPDRPLVQTGRPGDYTYQQGTPEQHATATRVLEHQAREAYAAYMDLLAAGVAREIARTVLPTSLYTAWYLTINLRSLFNLLSLRNATGSTTVPTHPQREAQMVAELMERHARGVVPFAMCLFDTYGRTAP